MNKWLQPSAYFGAYFGASEAVAPGAMFVFVVGFGSAVAHPNLSARLTFSASGSGSLAGTLVADQAQPSGDMACLISGLGRLQGTLVGGAVPLSEVTGSLFTRRPRSRSLSGPTLAMVAKGHGSLHGNLQALISLDLAAHGSGSLSGELATSVGEDLESLALILALVA